MAAPNLLNPTTATGKVVPLNLITSAQDLIVNAAASGTVVRVNAITIANAIGSANMMGYINNYRHIHRLPQNCGRWVIPHTMETIID